MKAYRCTYCRLTDSDPEVVFQHMASRECRAPRSSVAWVRRAQERRLPVKVWQQ